MHRLVNVWLVAIVVMVTAGADGFAQKSDPQRFDLVVYGGTAGGVVTAVAAAREGLRVALLEPGTHLGGMVSGGLGWTDHGAKETIGGYSLEFFQRVGKHYGEPITWYFEPRVAEAVFHDLVKEANVHLFKQHRLREKTGVTKRGTRIESITAENGTVFQARAFADASYEGDLMAQAKVSYTYGREGVDEFNESLAGVRDHTPKHQFIVRVSPYDENGKLLPEVSAAPKGNAGAADKRVQAYNFRVCMTERPDNRVAFPRPRNYDAGRYELLARMLEELDELKKAAAASGETTGREGNTDPMFRAKRPWSLIDVMKPDLLKNGKTDTNNNGAFSTDYIGGSYDYPEGDYATRARIWQDHTDYVQGFFYFLAHDARVPAGLKTAIAPWGLCKDEFTDTGHWPHQLYVREGRRMRGEYVMTQRDIQTDLTKPDSIGMGSYNSDSHNVQRVATPDGAVENEGDMQVAVQPYQIPYRMIVPKRSEATNLLVPVTFSATHVAYSTLRMEPQYMIIGHAAGIAIKLALDADTPVQDVDIKKLKDKLREQKTVTEWMRPAGSR